jgi:hypothetical protein
MFIIELLIWVVKFVFLSVFQLISFPFILFSAVSTEEKVQAFKESLMSAGILLGAYLIYVGSTWLGLGLIIGIMTFGALVIKDDGTF